MFLLFCGPSSKHGCASAWRSFHRGYGTDRVLSRLIRERPTEPREAYLARDKIQQPQYMAECRGTPRREYPVNLFNGIRVKATFNPYQKLTRQRRWRLAMWKSRKWDDWDPFSCYVGFGGQRYQVPDDLMPTKDELGCWQSPRLSARYVSDIKKQYIMHGLPWVWDKAFYKRRVHFTDREPSLRRHQYKTGNRRKKIAKAMRQLEPMKLAYLKEKKDARQYRWWERVVLEFGGPQALEEYGRIRKVPRLV